MADERASYMQPGAKFPGALQVIREQMPRFWQEPHTEAMRNVASIIPQTPSDLALEAALFPVGGTIRKALMTAAAALYSPESDAGPSALLRLASPEVRKWLDQVLRRVQPEDAERVENIVRDMPHTAEIYTPEAVSRAVDSAAQLRGTTPDQFLELAYPLGELDEFSEGLVKHYADLVRGGKWSEPGPDLFKDHYLERQRRTPFEGFSDVPFLQMQENPMSWLTTGHEGRHRNVVLQELYGEDTPQLTRFLKEYDSEKPLKIKYPHIVESEEGYGGTLDLSRTKRYAKGGLALWDKLKEFGFSDDDVERQQAFHAREREKGYLPEGSTNAEFDAGNYLTYAPDDIIPEEDWKFGPMIGGVHSPLRGVQVPNYSPTFPMSEVLAHEGMHKRALAMPSEDILGKERQAAKQSIMNQLQDYVVNNRRRMKLVPNGITTRKDLDELAPELMAHESYLPAGQRLTQSELGREVLRTPEEILWWMSRRYPTMKDPESGDFLDAMTSSGVR